MHTEQNQKKKPLWSIFFKELTSNANPGKVSLSNILGFINSSFWFTVTIWNNGWIYSHSSQCQSSQFSEPAVEVSCIFLGHQGSTEKEDAGQVWGIRSFETLPSNESYFIVCCCHILVLWWGSTKEWFGVRAPSLSASSTVLSFLYDRTLNHVREALSWALPVWQN